MTYVVPTDGIVWFGWYTTVGSGDGTWTVSGTPAPSDADDDGVLDADDACAGTVLPDQPTGGLKKNRFAANADGVFADSNGTSAGITLADTDGCSATQIIAAAGLGAGHTKFGISKAELMERVTLLSPVREVCAAPRSALGAWSPGRAAAPAEPESPDRLTLRA